MLFRSNKFEKCFLFLINIYICNEDYSIALGYLINKGYLSEGLKFDSKETDKEILGKPGISILQGSGCCRNICDMQKDIFERLFNLTFIECVDHFIGNKEIKELNGLTLFSELKEQILNKNEKDGESYYKNLEFFLKEFEKKINNAKSKNRKAKSI